MILVLILIGVSLYIVVTDSIRNRTNAMRVNRYLDRMRRYGSCKSWRA